MRFSFDAILASNFIPARFRAGGKLEKHGPDISKSAIHTKEAEITVKLAQFARVPVSDIFR